jgi:hypothetical protein
MRKPSAAVALLTDAHLVLFGQLLQFHAHLFSSVR